MEQNYYLFLKNLFAKQYPIIKVEETDVELDWSFYCQLDKVLSEINMTCSNPGNEHVINVVIANLGKKSIDFFKKLYVNKNWDSLEYYDLIAASQICELVCVPIDIIQKTQKHWHSFCGNNNIFTNEEFEKDWNLRFAKSSFFE